MAKFGSSGFGFIYPATRSWGSTAGAGEWDVIPAITTYSIVYDFNNTQLIRQESVINGHVNIIVKGNRQKIKINMHEIESTLYTSILASMGKVVKVRPHTDNEDMEFLCNVISVTPYYLENINAIDACIIELESQEYVELTVAD